MFAVANGPRSPGTHPSGRPLCLPACLLPGPTACPSTSVPTPCHSTGSSQISFYPSSAPSSLRCLYGKSNEPRRRTGPRNPAAQLLTWASGDPQPPSTWSWGQIHDWISANERPITTDGQDLFGRAPVATRIAEALREGRSVALLGAFGTGKSSILNLVLAKLRQCSTRTTRIIVARLDVWAVPRPEDAPRVALDQVIDALDHHVDTLGLRGSSDHVPAFGGRAPGPQYLQGPRTSDSGVTPWQSYSVLHRFSKC